MKRNSVSGYLENAQWHEGWYDTQATHGELVRTESAFRHWITADGSSGYPPALRSEIDRLNTFVYNNINTSDGSVGESSRKFLQGRMDHPVSWIKRHDLTRGARFQHSWIAHFGTQIATTKD